MIAKFKPCSLCGIIDAPPSKSMAHRYLIGAALSKGVSKITGIDYNEDVLATIDCLKTLGAEIVCEGDTVSINSDNFMNPSDDIVLQCRESGSTLRFFIPLALCLGKQVVLEGSERLFERPLDVYEELCRAHNFLFKKETDSVTLCGNLLSGGYKVRGDISSQFITGLIFALLYLKEDASIQVMSPFESRSYVKLTISALKAFGANIELENENLILIKKSDMYSLIGKIEGDYSNAAFLDAFNQIGSHVEVANLREDSLQGDLVYKEYFEKISTGTPTLDISDCPDLGPVLFALAALKYGATFTGTERLKVKESDRGQAMHVELQKLGGGLIFGENQIIVPKQELEYKGLKINGHNDHRIVMAMSLILSKTGGEIEGIEAVKKSYPNFFKDIKRLGADVEFIDM